MRPESKMWGRLRPHLGWYSRVEPGRGSTPGAPDLITLVKGTLMPVELKIGKLKHGLLHATLRPEQLIWHRSFSEAGGVGIVLVEAEEQLWAVRSQEAPWLKQGTSFFWSVRPELFGQDVTDGWRIAERIAA